MSAETSDKVSTLAGRYARITGNTVRQMNPDHLAADIRSMAASLLRQDQTKGLRGFVRRVLGRKPEPQPMDPAALAAKLKRENPDV